MDEKEELMEEEEEKVPWYHTKRNWGFWLLIISFILFCITWFIIKPMIGG